MKLSRRPQNPCSSTLRSPRAFVSTPGATTSSARSSSALARTWAGSSAGWGTHSAFAFLVGALAHRPSVVAQVSAEIVRPLQDRPYEGFLQIATEVSPMAGSHFEAGRCAPWF